MVVEPIEDFVCPTTPCKKCDKDKIQSVCVSHPDTIGSCYFHHLQLEHIVSIEEHMGVLQDGPK